MKKYRFLLFSDSPASELYLELLLLQVVVPALLEQGHTRQWLKNLVRAWCIGISWCLDIRSYLLGDVLLTDPVRAKNKTLVKKWASSVSCRLLRNQKQQQRNREHETGASYGLFIQILIIWPLRQTLTERKLIRLVVRPRGWLLLSRSPPPPPKSSALPPDLDADKCPCFIVISSDVVYSQSSEPRMY